MIQFERWWRPKNAKNRERLGVCQKSPITRMYLTRRSGCILVFSVIFLLPMFLARQAWLGSDQEFTVYFDELYGLWMALELIAEDNSGRKTVVFHRQPSHNPFVRAAKTTIRPIFARRGSTTHRDSSWPAWNPLDSRPLWSPRKRSRRLGSQRGYWMERKKTARTSLLNPSAPSHLNLRIQNCYTRAS